MNLTSQVNVTLDNVSEVLDETYRILDANVGQLNSTDIDNVADILTNAASVQDIPMEV